MNQPANIKILCKLATKVACNRQQRKAVELLIYLKHHNESGRFKYTDDLKKSYAKLSRICYNTFDTRINFLLNCGLLQLKQGTIYIPTWEKIAEHFGITGRLRYVYVKPPEGKGRIEHILEALAMREVLNKSEAAFDFYLKFHPEVKEMIRSVASGVNSGAVLHSQLKNFLLQYDGLDEDERLFLNLYRADISFNYKYWSKFFGYNSRGGFAYKKRKLQRLNLIHVNGSREYILERHTTTESRQTRLGHVHYDPRHKKPVLRMPDEILIKSLNQAA